MNLLENFNFNSNYTTNSTNTNKNLTVEEMYKKKLSESGLTLEDANQLGFELISTANKDFRSPGFKILYFTPDGLPLPDNTAFENCPQFWRFRRLGPIPKNSGKYIQNPGTLPVAYFPKNCRWKEVLDNNSAIIITEGELKAAKACKDGFPTIGLGGVWNWKSSAHGINLIESLQSINWARRYVFLCFDSDLKSNENVARALEEFSLELQRHGAYVFYASLPLDENKKVGLDDFLVANGPEEFLKILKGALPFNSAKALFEINDRYAIMASQGGVVDLRTQHILKFSDFKVLKLANKIKIKSFDKKGEIKEKTTSSAEYWLEWPAHFTLDNFTYEPGKPRFVENSITHGKDLNTWHGWGVESKKGNVKPFLDFIDYLFHGATDDEKQFVMHWLGYPIKFPGAKLLTALVLHGARQGTGKTLLAETMGKIYGKNYAEISQDDLENTFNSFIARKQFLSGDEITGSDSRRFADKLKKLITQSSVVVNEKYAKTYTIKDCANYLFTSNHVNCFFLEDSDRRMFVHEITAVPKAPEYYQYFIEWRDKEGGAEALRFYFENELDYEGFNPKSPAPSTTAKQFIIISGRSQVSTWAHDLQDESEITFLLKTAGAFFEMRDLFTGAELLALYEFATGTKKCVTSTRIISELKSCGVLKSLMNNNLIYLSSAFPRRRYYILRNHAKWEQASIESIREHILSVYTKYPPESIIKF